MIEEVKTLAVSSDAANRELALILARAQQFNEKEIAESCGALLDKTNTGQSYTAQLEAHADLAEKYPKMYAKMMGQ
jgi:hypothetical protein